MWGWGPFSSVATIVASKEPSQMSAVTTFIDSATGGVKILWTAPSSNGATISSYLIEIKDSVSGWRTETTNCDGSNPTIKSNL